MSPEVRVGSDAMPDALFRVPLHVAVAWESKVVTTDPPRLTPHTEWSLMVTLTASTRIRIAALVMRATETAWGLDADSSAQEVQVKAFFHPYSWSESDDVQVGIGNQRTRVSDTRLKHDPVEVVRVIAPTRAVTGEVIEVVQLDGHEVRLAVVAFAEEDTEQRRHDRWRIKPELVDALPTLLSGLASGHQTGVASA